MALGECIECPFRVMDEVDIFMDAVTRHLTLQILVEFGQLMKHRQFIIITPQNLDSIQPSESLFILRLHPPDRLTNT